MNSLKTFVLMVGLMVLFVWLGGLIGGSGGATVAFILALIMNVGVWWFSDKLVLATYGAKEVSAMQYPQLHSSVERLCQRANLPKPKICVIPMQQPNAFATGRSPRHSAVAVTYGALQLLTPDELEGVLAHELAHIKNRDTLIATIAATVAGTIYFLADMARWVGIFGRHGDNNEGTNPIALLVLSIVAPLAALLIQMAISRTREYSADATGAHFAGSSMGLANALRKLEMAAQRIPAPDASPVSAHLFIVNPLRGTSLLTLFSTHPPIAERIKRLQRMRI